ncbi:MAG TPA: hypothetical protein VHS96_18735, partial [Bacteroidia bacterium]|nr:hypothetical protein [Bacteroidia bacterium]
PNSNGIYFNGGNVGINTTTTNSKLDVNGSIAINHVQVIDGGGRWTGQPITGNENVTPRLSGNGNSIPLDIAQQGASNGQVLKWNGASWAPGTDNGGSGSYSAGNGLTLSGNTFSANSNSPIWNANQLQSIPVMNITPLNGQFLSYSSGQWFPNDLPTPVFRAGPGITTDGNLISAQTTNPLWNANSLNSRALPQGAPQVGQSLVYQQNGWTYSAVGGQDYNSGAGIAISGNTISAQTTNPLWNANSLNSRALPQGAPQVGQSLVYQQNGWTYSAVGGQDYNAGTGIAISGNTISAQNENPIWNAAVLNSKPLPQGSPQTGESLLFGISGWEYDTVGGKDYDAGIGLVITGNLIAAQNSNPIWNSNSLNSRPLPTGAPLTGESLVYGVSGWEYDTVGGQDYDAGIGLVITGNLIAAQNSNPIWNANSLDSRPLPSGIPLSGQSLVYRNGGWGYETIAPDYVAGSGIIISNNVIQAENTEPIWNANQLSGHNVGTISPENGQVLQYNGVAWVPGDIAQSSGEANGWETDTLPGGVVNLLTSVNGAVGIGTENPQAELDVFGGIAVKGILVVNDSGQWVGPVVIDSATQAMMDTMAAQQAAIHASMEELKHAQDSLSAGIAIINQGADVIKQGDSLLQVATTQADSAAAQAMIALGQGQIEAGQATVDAGQAQSSAAQADMAATISGLSATLSAASAAISAASATAAALAAIEASAAAAEASIAAGEATIAAAEATGAAVEASLAALEASGAAGDASADAADASADAATASRKAADAKDSADDAKDSADKAKEYAEGNVGGDLSGNMPNPTVAKIQGHAVSSTAPTANKVLKYINNQWQPSLDSNTTYRAGTGIVIRHDSIFAQNSSPMWNANKLQGWALSGTAPAANQVLKWRNNAWIPANDSSATYKGGLGILVRRDSIFAKNDSAIWNATKLRGRAISANVPATNQVLKWRNNAWIPANDSSVTYKAGTGIAIRQDSIFAQSGSAIWNASKLQGFAVADSAPASQQVLKFLDGKWKPAVDSVVHYKGGTGIVVQRDSIFARADSAIWNSNALMGYGIDTLRPDSGQALVWNGQKWQPQRFAQSAPQGWAIDTMAGDTIMYATIPGNIGIGTTRPTQKLMVQGGSTGASDSVFVVNSEGRVGIGTANPSDHFKLSVNGAIRAKKVVVESGWADYVFDEEYSLRPLPELRKYIAENHHLPGVESADAIAENGLDLAKTQQQMMEKIEELTLYLLQIEEQ